ncbi:MAG: hypothetical protein H6651_08750 [Ardenticatenales bacterium]|nr:hypothetical protein [Ardenticatenales bacterium]
MNVLIQLEPGWSAHRANLAALYWQAGDTAAAISMMESAAAMSPDVVIYSLNLIVWRESLGQAAEPLIAQLANDDTVWHQAPFLTERMATPAAANNTSLVYLGPTAAEAAGLTEQAWTALYDQYRLQSERDPYDSRAYLTAGIAALFLNQPDEAGRLWRRADIIDGITSSVGQGGQIGTELNLWRLLQREASAAEIQRFQLRLGEQSPYGTGRGGQGSYTNIVLLRLPPGAWRRFYTCCRPSLPAAPVFRWTMAGFTRRMPGIWRGPAGGNTSPASSAPVRQQRALDHLVGWGYLLHLPYFFWVFLSGAVSLAWIGLVSARLWQTLWPAEADRGWQIIAIVCAHLAPDLGRRQRHGDTAVHRPRPAGDPGLLPGWPEPLGGGPGGAIGRDDDPGPAGWLPLLLLLALALLVGTPGLTWRQRLTNVLLTLAAAALPLIPYFLFNRWASDQWWPNTFYAKQSEYAMLLAEPLWQRFLRLLYFSLGGPESGWRGISGAHLLLLPGLIAAGLNGLRADLRQRRFHFTLPLLWAGGHVLLYAWRLPVTFQHGRYLMAALPVWTLYGVAGWLPLLAGLKSKLNDLWLRAIPLVYVAMVLVFFLLGLTAYLNDVAFINGEMVQVAHWLNDNTPEDAIIAAHDIGAIGYFTERQLVDMAGLITPDLVPFLAHEPSLFAYLRNLRRPIPGHRARLAL